MPGKGCVTFIELALDFEAHSGKAMPAAPSAELESIVLSLHERARVLRTALAVLQKNLKSGTLVPGTMTLKARSLVPLGAGPLAGLTSRPYFTRRSDMLQQLRSLAEYSEQRWTSKIRAGVSFNVGTSTQQRPAEGAREQRSRLHAADNWNMAHQLTEGGASCGDITSKGGGAGKRRCLFTSDYMSLRRMEGLLRNCPLPR